MRKFFFSQENVTNQTLKFVHKVINLFTVSKFSFHKTLWFFSTHFLFFSYNKIVTMKIQPSITKFQELNNTIWQRKITFKIDSIACYMYKRIINPSRAIVFFLQITTNIKTCFLMSVLFPYLFLYCLFLFFLRYRSL